MSRVRGFKLMNGGKFQHVISSGRFKTFLRKATPVFAILNGFLGLKRDIVLRLCIIMQEKKCNLKAVFGMCKECFEWRNHAYFVEKLKAFVPHSLRPNPKGSCTLTESDTGNHPKCEFAYDCEHVRTVFLNQRISKGVWRWTVQIEYGTEPFSEFWLGSCQCSSASRFDDYSLGRMFRTASYDFWRDRGILYSRLYGALGAWEIPEEETPVPNGALVAVEVNIDDRTMSFFVNQIKVRRAVSCIHFPLFLGVTGFHGPAFTSVSLCRRVVPTPSGVIPKLYRCIYVDLRMRKLFHDTGKKKTMVDGDSNNYVNIGTINNGINNR